jgi:hypothetical protein
MEPNASVENVPGAAAALVGHEAHVGGLSSNPSPSTLLPSPFALFYLHTLLSHTKRSVCELVKESAR